ncbi:MAG: response regulator transcription factor [Ideonella sp.]|nr:response regulator transcription factor [Ideonella sp.]MBP6776812.1 response regulator transcription factor [Piscinibacter sp.]
MRPRAVIAEDEPMLLGQLRESLARLWPELEVVAEAEDGVQAIQALNRHDPDVIFLDIQMPGMSGLEVARVASGRCHVVFVTAYDEYAVAAFEHGAVDYLMKPWSAARLAASIARLRERAGAEPARLEQLLQRLASQGRSAQYLRWISVDVGRTTQLITCDEICYFQADNKYTVVVTPTSQPLINRTIRQLATELDPSVFVQIHRATLVNINAIAAIDRNLRGSLSVRLKQRPERLPVSATHAHVFRHM